MSRELINGIGVVIDDQLFGDKSDGIHSIVEMLNDEGIPLVKFEDIPQRKFYEKISDVSFILMDWKLKEKGSTTLKKKQIENNIEFIKDLKKYCFAPLFIFSKESKKDIVDKLEPEGLFDSENPINNHIFIKSKNDFSSKKVLMDSITAWIEEHPAAYLIKKWDSSLSQARLKTYWHLFEKSPNWPKIIWNTFEKDQVDEGSNLNDYIFKMIKSRTSLSDLEKEKISIDDDSINEEDLKKVINSTIYIPDSEIDDKNFVPGDIFKPKDGEDKYYLNIRPSCDTIVSRSSFDNKLYLLRGTKYSNKEIRKHKRYNKKFGLVERPNDVVLFGLDGHNFIKFKFKVLKIEKVDKLDGKRICRVLPPHITNIQQKYSSYIGRYGVPRLPDDLVKSMFASEK